MRIRNMVAVGILLISLSSIGCATSGSMDDLRSKFSAKDSLYCCVWNDPSSDVTPSHSP
jgi:hypothetical protein